MPLQTQAEASAVGLYSWCFVRFVRRQQTSKQCHRCRHAPPVLRTDCSHVCCTHRRNKDTAEVHCSTLPPCLAPCFSFRTGWSSDRRAPCSLPPRRLLQYCFHSCGAGQKASRLFAQGRVSGHTNMLTPVPAYRVHACSGRQSAGAVGWFQCASQN